MMLSDGDDIEVLGGRLAPECADTTQSRRKQGLFDDTRVRKLGAWHHNARSRGTLDLVPGGVLAQAEVVRRTARRIGS
jgi:hypothetical protein